MQYTDIRFPHLGIVLSHVGRYISIGDFQIMFYGIIIACGFLVGLWVAQQEAKRTGQNPEIYMDYLLVMMIPAIIGARIYYVVFSWDSYKDNIPEIFNLRHGGLWNCRRRGYGGSCPFSLCKSKKAECAFNA